MPDANFETGRINKIICFALEKVVDVVFFVTAGADRFRERNDGNWNYSDPGSYGTAKQ